MLPYLFKRIVFIVGILVPFIVKAQSADLQNLKKISDQILLYGKSYDDLTYLTKQIGHRLSGTASAQKAVEWGRDVLIKAGADSVWLAPVKVPRWHRGKEHLQIKISKGAWQNIEMLSLGNSIGTDGVVLEAPIICVSSLEAFEQLSEDDVKGKIVFFNYPFNQSFVNTFEAYGDAVKYRWLGVNKASEKGAAGAIIRSMSTRLDGIPHTGMTRYMDGVRPIPAVAIGNQSAINLAAAIEKHTVIAQLNSECKMLDSVVSYNVIGEIKGHTTPENIIVVSGHLDSWDVGEGAHDDGAGCVQSIEVIRTFKALGIPNKNTIRAILFMNEENGVQGGKTYAENAGRQKENHLFAIESDAGGFSPKGIGLEMDDSLKSIIKSWQPHFNLLEIYDFSKEESGVDIGPLKKYNVPLAGLLPDSQRYFEVHHNRMDVLEAVNHRELKMGALVMATLIYLVDQNF